MIEHDDTDTHISTLARELAQRIMENQEELEQLETPSQKKERLQIEIQEEFNKVYANLEEGMVAIVAKLNDLGLMNEEVEKDISVITDKALYYKDHMEECLDLLNKNISLFDYFSLNPATEESMYQAARSIYEEQSYEDAWRAFQVLVLLDSTQVIFWMGFGNSQYLCQNYEAALEAYKMLASFDVKDPLCRIFAARSYLEVHDYEKALQLCNDALQIISGEPTYRELFEEVNELKLQIEYKQSL
jgi:TolA-binding protein